MAEVLRKARRTQSGSASGSGSKGRSGAPWGRLIVGFVGGYPASTSLVQALLFILPFDRSEETMWGLMLVILAYLAMAVGAFGARSWQVAALHLFGVSAASNLVLLSGRLTG